MRPARRSRRRGFALIEALLSLVLASLLFGGIALFTSGWTRHWGAVFLSGSQQDVAAIVLDRLVEEIEAAQPALVRDGQAYISLFEGAPDAIAFIRPALGFEARAGLDRVTYRIGPAGDGGAALLRIRRDHDPRRSGSGGEDLPLLRGGVAIAFFYAGADGRFAEEWTGASRLPSVVRIELSGPSPRPWRRVAYARPRAEWPASCSTEELVARCEALFRTP